MIKFLFWALGIYFAVSVVMKVKQNPNNWPLLLKFIPLTAFLFYARMQGLTTLAWKQAFIVGGIFSIVVLLLQLYKNITLDRLMLGVNTFLFIGGFAFLFNIIPLLYLYSGYKAGVFFGCIVLVGLITTFFTKKGFIGVEHPNTQKASLTLLTASFGGLIWAIAFSNQSIAISAALPFVFLKFFQDILIKKTD